MQKQQTALAFVVLFGIAAIFGAIFLTSDPGSTTVWATREVTVEVTSTPIPTRTPEPATQTPFVVTATPTMSATQPPLCTADMPAGTLCAPYHQQPTPTPQPTCESGSTTFQSVCRIPGEPDMTTGENETK